MASFFLQKIIDYGIRIVYTYVVMGKLEELSERIKQFNKERDWDQFHSPSNLAKSISIEAGELLECFQWSDTEYNRDDVVEELADVANYCIQMSQVLGVDLIDVVNAKMDISEKKYPVDKAKGVSMKYDKLIYLVTLKGL